MSLLTSELTRMSPSAAAITADQPKTIRLPYDDLASVAVNMLDGFGSDANAVYAHCISTTAPLPIFHLVIGKRQFCIEHGTGRETAEIQPHEDWIYNAFTDDALESLSVQCRNHFREKGLDYDRFLAEFGSVLPDTFPEDGLGLSEEVARLRAEQIFDLDL